MEKTPSIYTPTMARVLEKQGKDAEALRIYRHLLSSNSKRTDLVNARNRLEARLKSKPRNRLINLFEEWIDLLLLQERIRILESLENKKTFKLSEDRSLAEG